MSATEQPFGHYYVSIDLGQASDPSALAVAGQRIPPGGEATYSIGELIRYPLRTPYPEIVRLVSDLVRSDALKGMCSLIVDGTGVGRPVVDAFLAADLPCPVVAVLITGGDNEIAENPWWRVPKRNLAGVVAILLQNQRLKTAASLEHAQTLALEMANFRVKIDPRTANDSYSAWREGQHDDLLLAVAMACWAGERRLGTGWRDMPNEIPLVDHGAQPFTRTAARDRVKQKRAARQHERVQRWRAAGWID